jgi:hypothetical protein
MRVSTKEDRPEEGISMRVVDKISIWSRPEAQCATFTVLETFRDISDKSTERALKAGLAAGNPCVFHGLL